MNLTDMITLTGAAFLLSLAFTWCLAHLNTSLAPTCEVNTRSLHRKPVPRGGGLAIVASLLICKFAGWQLGLLPGNIVAPWLIAVILLGTVSYIDDHRHVPSALRLLAQVLSVGVVVFWLPLPIQGLFPGFHLEIGPITTLFALLFGVWMVNLYNFMDGMDGFAAGMAGFGFGALAIMGWIQGSEGFMLANLLVVAGALGFLVFNFPPAKIFLGDIGSTVLGLLAAAYSLWAAGNGLIPLWISVLAFSPFIVDATITLLMRAARGEKVWQAHLEHFFQRLVCLDAALDHSRTLTLEYILMFSCALSAILALNADLVTQWLIVGLWVLIYAGLLIWVIWVTENRFRAGTASKNVDNRKDIYGS